MSASEQFAKTTSNAQELWREAIETWTNTVQKAFGQPASMPSFPVDPNAVIDQVFDFTQKALDAQRSFMKDLAQATATVSEAVTKQAESAGEAVRSRTQSAGDAVRNKAKEVGEAVPKATQTVASAASQQSEKKYDDKTKVELQEELAVRDLPKTGNVDELRARLLADDKK